MAERLVIQGAREHNLKDVSLTLPRDRLIVFTGLSGSGNPQHLVMERLRLEEGIKWNAIPFKNGAEAVVACMGKHVTAMAGVSEWVPQVQSGDMRLLAVFDDERMKEFPEVPTLKELGYDIVAPSILGIAGPAGIPGDVVAKIDKAVKNALNDARMVELMEKIMIKIAYLDHEAFTGHVNKVYAEQGEIIKAAGLGK